MSDIFVRYFNNLNDSNYTLSKFNEEDRRNVLTTKNIEIKHASYFCVYLMVLQFYSTISYKKPFHFLKDVKLLKMNSCLVNFNSNNLLRLILYTWLYYKKWNFFPKMRITQFHSELDKCLLHINSNSKSMCTLLFKVHVPATKTR